MASLHPHGQAKDIMSDYKSGILENSAKMVLLFHLIEESVRKGDKLLVFRYEIRRDASSSGSFLLTSPIYSGFCLIFPLRLSSAVRVCPH